MVRHRGSASRVRADNLGAHTVPGRPPGQVIPVAGTLRRLPRHGNVPTWEPPHRRVSTHGVPTTDAHTEQPSPSHTGPTTAALLRFAVTRAASGVHPRLFAILQLRAQPLRCCSVWLRRSIAGPDRAIRAERREAHWPHQAAPDVPNIYASEMASAGVVMARRPVLQLGAQIEASLCQGDLLCACSGARGSALVTGLWVGA